MFELAAAATSGGVIAAAAGPAQRVPTATPATLSAHRCGGDWLGCWGVPAANCHALTRHPSTQEPLTTSCCAAACPACGRPVPGAAGRHTCPPAAQSSRREPAPAGRQAQGSGAAHVNPAHPGAQQHAECCCTASGSFAHRQLRATPSGISGRS